VIFANLPQLNDWNVESFLFDRGKVVPIFMGWTLTPGTARQYADPKMRERLVSQIVAEINERYGAVTDEELPIPALRTRVEESIGLRFGRPGRLLVNVTGIGSKPLAPKATVSIPEM
jgi:hypothetical protein